MKDDKEQLSKEIEDLNTRIEDARKLVGYKKDSVRELVNSLNDKINKCKGFEGKIKQTLEEYERQNVKLSKDKLGIKDLLDKLSAILHTLKSL